MHQPSSSFLLVLLFWESLFPHAIWHLSPITCNPPPRPPLLPCTVGPVVAISCFPPTFPPPSSQTIAGKNWVLICTDSSSFFPRYRFYGPARLISQGGRRFHFCLWRKKESEKGTSGTKQNKKILADDIFCRLASFVSPPQ